MSRGGRLCPSPVSLTPVVNKRRTSRRCSNVPMNSSSTTTQLITAAAACSHSSTAAICAKPHRRCRSGWLKSLGTAGRPFPNSLCVPPDGSYRYQVHLLHWLESSNYGVLLSDNDAYIKVKRLIYLSGQTSKLDGIIAQHSRCVSILRSWRHWCQVRMIYGQ